jgi:hypothetical protein
MRIGEWLAQGFGGPAHLRFFIQPLVALLLGLRDGHADALAGKPPYFMALFQQPETRSASLQEGLRQIVMPFSVGIVIDGVVQYMLMRHVYLWMALAVGILLVGLPYAVFRGMANRLFRRRTARHA